MTRLAVDTLSEHFITIKAVNFRFETVDVMDKSVNYKDGMLLGKENFDKKNLANEPSHAIFITYFFPASGTP